MAGWNEEWEEFISTHQNTSEQGIFRCREAYGQVQN